VKSKKYFAGAKLSFFSSRAHQLTDLPTHNLPLNLSRYRSIYVLVTTRNGQPKTDNQHPRPVGPYISGSTPINMHSIK